MGEVFEISIGAEEYFRLSNGRILKNLNELLNALKSMDVETFEFHVNEQKNDFGNWIKDVFKDPELAKSVFNSKTREDIIKALESEFFEPDRKEYIKIKANKLQPDADKIRKRGKSAKPKLVKKALEPKKLLKTYPFVKSSAKAVLQKSEPASSSALSAKNSPAVKIEEILMKEKEIEKREEKIEEIESRIEKELAELAARKEPKFFSKEFIHGVLIGLLSALIIGIAYIKFFS